MKAIFLVAYCLRRGVVLSNTPGLKAMFSSGKINEGFWHVHTCNGATSINEPAHTKRGLMAF